ncbi:phosphotransferase [Paenibacillus thalictri]|uniref:phosphotransferase n=1 Tax=Paenibacillus thalictri TaxID=2527873 RepID=UPI001F0F0844|nr:phosphotransferase [Paenibacillus thalictri]
MFAVEKMGLTGITPNVLSQGGNLIVHLAPHPVVARMAVVRSQEYPYEAYRMLDREIQAVSHLHAKGVPVLLPTNLIEPKPHDIGGIWTTFWTYVPPVNLPSPSSPEALGLVSALSVGIADFPQELPQLGVWEQTCLSAARLRQQSDRRVQALLQTFERIDEQMRTETRQLVPCHGDAHRRNLLPSPACWLWTDFEDMSRMPAYWDLASYVGNLVLLGGMEEPTFNFVWNNVGNEAKRHAFSFALIARTLMSTLGNLDFALAGRGDMEFAERQLELAGGFIRQMGNV